MAVWCQWCELSGSTHCRHFLEIVGCIISPNNFPAGQIEHFAQGIVVGKAGLVLCELAELAVQALNDIRRVYDFPNLGGICEKGTQNIHVPGPPERLNPASLSVSGARNGIHAARAYRFSPRADKAGRGADLVDDAPLYLALGIDRPNGLHKTLQTVHAEPTIPCAKCSIWPAGKLSGTGRPDVEIGTWFYPSSDRRWARQKILCKRRQAVVKKRGATQRIFRTGRFVLNRR